MVNTVYSKAFDPAITLDTCFLFFFLLELDKLLQLGPYYVNRFKKIRATIFERFYDMGDWLTEIPQ